MFGIGVQLTGAAGAKTMKGPAWRSGNGFYPDHLKRRRSQRESLMKTHDAGREGKRKRRRYLPV